MRGVASVVRVEGGELGLEVGWGWGGGEFDPFFCLYVWESFGGDLNF